jgi:NAD(P) transhydrogenase subunit alpha
MANTSNISDIPGSTSAKIGILTETQPGERRVALIPELAAMLIASDFEVTIEAGAGEQAGFSDESYRAKGAGVEASRQALLNKANIVLSVQPLALEEITLLQSGTITISFLQPAKHGESIKALADRGVTAFSLELLPRISRAQSMDVLSSQASLAGYKAVLMAANRLNKFFPMLMTAAGTIPPAHVLVLGAGVAGLQAIATARRLGAVVEAYDVRAAAQEEVKSLGAKFLGLELENQEGTGGYAREQNEAFLNKQREMLTKHIAASDVVITTAAIPGRRAPRLITSAMVRNMRPGTVIVDLAAETGGNCELTCPGQVIQIAGVWIDGTTNIPSTMAYHASQLYARNVSNLLQHLVRHGILNLDFKDEITRGCCVTYAGEIIHPQVRTLMETNNTQQETRLEIEK